MTPTLILDALISGILISGLYITLGVGLSLIYGVMGIVNLAQGDFVVLGGYMSFFLFTLLGVNPFLAIAPIAISFFAVGLVVYSGVAPKLNKAEDKEQSSLIAFFGISLAIEAVAQILWGTSYREISFSLPISSISLLGVVIPFIWLVTFFFSIVVSIILFLFLYRTHVGKAIRAVISNADEARTSGIDIIYVSRLVFGIGIAIAGITGVFLQFFSLAIYPSAGLDYTILAFIVASLGGLDNPLGTFLGGAVLGLTQGFEPFVLPPSLLPLVTALLVIFIFAIKPRGLMPRW